MSLITRCSACQTMFKVVPDQLRVSEGWVRCGQCGEIFDASLQLVRFDANGPVEPGAGRDPSAPAVAPQRGLPEPETGPVPGWNETPGREPQTGAVDLVWPLGSGQNSMQDAALAATAAPAEPDGAAVAAAGAGPDRLEQSRPDGPAPVAPEVSFLRRGAAPARWQRGWVRALLGACAVLLLSLLGLQVGVHERDRIAALYPQAAPVLRQACSVLGCQVSALRQIEALSIDSSSLARIRADLFRLGFVLKNSGPLELAMPAVELTLTDSQDQALVRRVLLPADFTAAAQRLSAGSDLSSSLALQLRMGTGADRVAGYRVLAFYP